MLPNDTYRAALCDWVRANGAHPEDVLDNEAFGVRDTAFGPLMNYTVIKRGTDGEPLIDGDMFLTETKTVPCVVPTPTLV